MNRWKWVFRISIFSIGLGLFLHSDDNVYAARGYGQRLATQLQLIKVRPEQNKAFQRHTKRYYRQLNNAPRKVMSTRRGDFHTMIKREVKSSGKQAVKNMEDVLDEDQLKHFRRYIKIAGDNYVASLGID